MHACPSLPSPPLAADKWDEELQGLQTKISNLETERDAAVETGTSSCACDMTIRVLGQEDGN